MLNRHDSGWSFAEIGEMYGLTKWQVRDRVRAFSPGQPNAKRRKYTDDENAEIVRLGNQGLTNREIAEQVGCSASYAGTTCRKAWSQKGAKE